MRVSLEMEQRGRRDIAHNKITLAIKCDPSVPLFHVIRGDLHRKMLNYPRAVDDFLVAVEKSDKGTVPFVKKKPSRNGGILLEVKIYITNIG